MNNLTKKIWTEFNVELKRFIFSKVKDQHIADDILQDVFLKIIENSDRISEARNTQQYIYAIARNTIVDHYRNAYKKSELLEKEVSFTESESSSLNTSIAECCIKPFIAQLPEKYQHALTEIEFENTSQKELAERLNLSYSGTKSRIQRGRAKLKDLILACCNFKSDAYGNLQPLNSKNHNCD